MSFVWVGFLGLGLLLPVLAAVWLRPGWLLLAVIGWLLVPALFFAVMAGVEVQARPRNPEAARDVWLGFYLMHSLLVLPWLCVSAVLWGLGLLLRRWIGPHARKVAAGAPVRP